MTIAKQVNIKDIKVGDKILYYGGRYEVKDIQEKYITVRPLHAQHTGGEIWYDHFEQVFKLIEED